MFSQDISQTVFCESLDFAKQFHYTNNVMFSVQWFCPCD